MEEIARYFEGKTEYIGVFEVISNRKHRRDRHISIKLKISNCDNSAGFCTAGVGAVATQVERSR